MKSTNQIRQMFLDFYNSKGHKVVESSSLIPFNDPTLLFTNAGMNQFKDVFLGTDKRPYTTATTAQRCVRAGGKHNDLDNVGYTARHHTFFEMLGNFSFGDYFKRDAIYYAWELLIHEKWFNIPKERLLVTVYHDDNDAYRIWLEEIGIPSDKIIRIGDNKGEKYASDNFWQMGDTGPCGPCTEIFYDHGEHIWGGPPGSADEDGDRFIEIWNLVFMQFNRQKNGSMIPLPKPSVDTGMGLERISAVLQHVNSNYEIDIFQSLIKETAALLNITDHNNKSLNVIADHIRSCAFLISDGVIPSNEGRGYVLRRIIRRAIRHGNMLGAKDIFFYKLAKPLTQIMGDAASELVKQLTIVENTLKIEEEQFLRTLDKGLNLLEHELKNVKNACLSGDVAFKLYDTYGFPFDLTADVCREKSITVDEEKFVTLMDEQRRRSKESDAFSVDYNNVIDFDMPTEFIGYRELEADAKILAIYSDNKRVDELKLGEQGVIILDKTPFYGESGGQAGDKGQLSVALNEQFDVVDTQKHANVVLHLGTLTKGKLIVGQNITASVEQNIRERTKNNHSATHLLHAALRQILGKHVQQKGSLVNEHHLRFDFSHPTTISQEQLLEIEKVVNRQIRNNHVITTELMSIDEAKNKGAMALFSEKYQDTVRVLTMGEFSIELCGGTHAESTGSIGLFKIKSEASVAAGIRRIEAVTGQVAVEQMQEDNQIIVSLLSNLKTEKSTLLDKIDNLLSHQKVLEKELTSLKSKEILSAATSLINQAININQHYLLVTSVNDIPAKELRELIDDFKNRLKSAIIVLASVVNNKINLAVGVTDDLTLKFKAGNIVSEIAQKLGGKGGGRPDFAQAGGSDIVILPDVLASLKMTLESELSSKKE